MQRIRDLDAALAFHADMLGMRPIRRKDTPEGGFSLAFVGDGDESDSAVLELTHNRGDHEYDLGNACGHIATGVHDVYAACARIKAAGGNVVCDAGPMEGGATVIAFVEDPDGYKVELISTESVGR